MKGARDSAPLFSCLVIPAKAGIQLSPEEALDSGSSPERRTAEVDQVR
jgi:hypothetical protein